MADDKEAVAPLMPAVSVDFNKLHETLLKNPDAGDAALKAAIVTPSKAASPSKTETKPAADKGAGAKE